MFLKSNVHGFLSSSHLSCERCLVSFAGWVKSLIDKGSRTEKAQIASAMMRKQANGLRFELAPDSMQAQETLGKFQKKYFDEKAVGTTRTFAENADYSYIFHGQIPIS